MRAGAVSRRPTNLVTHLPIPKPMLKLFYILMWLDINVHEVYTSNTIDDFIYILNLMHRKPAELFIITILSNMIQKASFLYKIIHLEATISCEKPKLKNK